MVMDGGGDVMPSGADLGSVVKQTWQQIEHGGSPTNSGCVRMRSD